MLIPSGKTLSVMAVINLHFSMYFPRYTTANEKSFTRSSLASLTTSSLSPCQTLVIVIHRFTTKVCPFRSCLALASATLDRTSVQQSVHQCVSWSACQWDVHKNCQYFEIPAPALHCTQILSTTKRYNVFYFSTMSEVSAELFLFVLQCVCVCFKVRLISLRALE